MQRSHNEIARGLKKVNPFWTDEILFQEARRILVAVYQNIIYSEYLELLLGKAIMTQFGFSLLANGYSQNYNEYLYPNIYNEFVAAAFRLHHTVHTGIHFLNNKFEEVQIEIPGLNYIRAIELDDLRLNNWVYYDQITTLMSTFLGRSTYQANFSLLSGMNHKISLVSFYFIKLFSLF